MAKEKMSQKEIDEKVKKALSSVGKRVVVEFEEYGRKEENEGILRSFKRYRTDISGGYTGVEIGNQGYPLSSVKKITQDRKIIYENPNLQYSRKD